MWGRGERLIVEAGPLDRFWGVGFGEKRALSVKQSWGLNLLGRALMDVRRILRESEMAKYGSAKLIELLLKRPAVGDAVSKP